MPTLSSREKTELFVELQNKIEQIEKSIGFDDKDIRKLVFSNSRLIIQSGTMCLNVFASIEENDYDHKVYSDLFGLQEPLPFFGLYAKFNKLALVTLLQFQIENFLKILLYAVTGNVPPRGFYTICELLLTSITIQDSEHKQNILYVPAMIRNTLHSSGIHTEKTKSVIIDNENFEFIKGKNISCATWYHLHKSFNASIDIIKEIISTEEISSIKHTIPHQYFTIK